LDNDKYEYNAIDKNDNIDLPINTKNTQVQTLKEMMEFVFCCKKRKNDCAMIIEYTDSALEIEKNSNNNSNKLEETDRLNKDHKDDNKDDNDNKDDKEVNNKEADKEVDIVLHLTEENEENNYNVSNEGKLCYDNGNIEGKLSKSNGNKDGTKDNVSDNSKDNRKDNEIDLIDKKGLSKDNVISNSHLFI